MSIGLVCSVVVFSTGFPLMHLRLVGHTIVSIAKNNRSWEELNRRSRHKMRIWKKLARWGEPWRGRPPRQNRGCDSQQDLSHMIVLRSDSSNCLVVCVAALGIGQPAEPKQTFRGTISSMALNF